MRCSRSEAALAEYVEGTLAPPLRAQVARHVAECDACGVLLHELRSIDALLASSERPDLAPNFTFKVMAEVRAMPAPAMHRPTLFGVLASYVAFAWISIALYVAFAGPSARAAYATLASSTTRFGSGVFSLATAAGHLFGGHAFGITAAVGAILTVDATAAVAVVLSYGYLRPRLAARLVPPEAC